MCREVNVPKGIVATALNQSSVSEQRSRVSIGLDMKDYYKERKHGSREEVNVFVDDHEGVEIVESIQWLLAKVSEPQQDTHSFLLKALMPTKNNIIPTRNSPIQVSRRRTIATQAPLSDWLFREEIVVSKGEAQPNLDRFKLGSHHPGLPLVSQLSLAVN
jgi:hypothetical protein